MTTRGLASDPDLQPVAAALAVTTCYEPGPAHLERARAIAERFSARLVARDSFASAFAATGAAYLYVVQRAHDEVRDAAGNTCFVQEGMLATKLTDGRAHPFMRAILGGDARVQSVIDGTLGLANDALHIATVLECSVRGIEGSPLLHALLEEGLPRLARTGWPHASRISVEHALALDALRACPDHSVDVVSLDPMMSRPRKSAPSFSLLRDFAVNERASSELLHEAARVARRRVVLKLGRGAPLPAESPYAFEHFEPGARVTYWVHAV